MRRLLALFAIVGVGLSAPGCSDERPDGVGGGRRDGGAEDDGGGFVPRDAAPSRPPPDTIVPCRLLSDPRGLTVGEGSGAQLPSVVPGRFADEIALAYPRGPSGPSRVTVELVSSDGDVLDDPTFATPEHPQVSSPALVETPRGAMLAYVHDEFPPPRAYLVTRLRDDLPWSDPVPLSDGFREIRRLRAVPIADQGALVAFREVAREGEEPARLRLGRVDPDADVQSPPAVVEGTDGVSSFALASRDGEALLVFDLPSATGDGRDIVAREVDARGDVGGSPTMVATDRRLAGELAALRLAPDRDGSNDDVRLVAWSEVAGDGVISNVHLARLGDGAFEDLLTSGAATGTSPALAPLFDDWFVTSWRVDPANETTPGTIRMRVGRPFRTGGLAVRDVFSIQGAQSGVLVTGSSQDGWAVGVGWTENGPAGFRTRFGTARCTDRSP